MSGRSILRLFVIALAFISADSVLGQDRSNNSTDITPSNSKNTESRLLRADSIQAVLQERTDSLQNRYRGKLSQMDSLQDNLAINSIVQQSTQKIDSIQSQFYQRSDSIKNIYKRKLSKLDATKSSVQHKADSLTTLKLPANTLLNRVDSLNEVRRNMTAEFDKKLQSIKDQTTAKLNKLDLPPEVGEKVNSIAKNIEGINLSSSEIDIPSLNVSNDVNQLGDLSVVGKNQLPSELSGKTPDVNTPIGANDMNSLTKADGEVAEVTNVSGQINEYTADAKQIAKGNLDEAKNIPKTAEEKAAEVSGIGDIEQKTKALDQYKTMTGKAQDPEALKKEVTEKAKQVAVNHFAGKEEQLKTAMEKMARYKQKYSSMSGVSELSKKRVNPLHGKPLIERIVPGVALQLQSRGENVLVDFNPYAAYLFTTRLRAGAGWNQRLGYDTDYRGFNSSVRIYGPRVFGEFKLGKGFSPRAEIELMNTRIPPTGQTSVDPFHREWIPGAFVGLKKQYKLLRNINGTAFAMVRVFNPGHKSPYADILNVRFGFEIPLKKKVKPKD